MNNITLWSVVFIAAAVADGGDDDDDDGASDGAFLAYWRTKAWNLRDLFTGFTNQIIIICCNFCGRQKCGISDTTSFTQLAK